eukprot:8962169-Heterocapsa_arctica.AAC.1
MAKIANAPTEMPLARRSPYQDDWQDEALTRTSGRTMPLPRKTAGGSGPRAKQVPSQAARAAARGKLLYILTGSQVGGLGNKEMRKARICGVSGYTYKR